MPGPGQFTPTGPVGPLGADPRGWSDVGLAAQDVPPQTGVRRAVEALPVPGAMGNWDASDTSTIDNTAGEVTAWRDETAGLTAIGSAGQRPTTGTRTQHGLNVLDFMPDGVTATRLEFDWLDQPQPLTLFLVVKSDLTDGTNRQPIGNVSTDDVVFTNANQWRMYAGTEVGGPTLDTNPHVVCAVFDGAASVLSVDGAETTGLNPGANPSTTLMLGAGSGYSSPWDGWIGQVVWFPRALGAADRSLMVSFLLARWMPPTVVPVGQAVESDTGQLVRAQHVGTLGQPAGSNTAQAIRPQHARTLGQPAETDTATVTGHYRRAAVGQATGTSTAQPIRAQHVRIVGQAVETDTATVTAHYRRAPVGQAVATNTAQPITAAHARTLGQPSEADTATVTGHYRRAAVGQGAELDTAQLVTAAHRAPAGQAAEADSAQAVRAQHRLIVGQAVEADTAQPVTRASNAQTITVGQAAESDTANQLRPQHSRNVAIAAELDQALVAGAAHRTTVGQASSSSTAQPIRPAHARTTGQATETDTAATTGHYRRVPVGIAVEGDTAGPITTLGRHAVGQAAEADQALAVRAVKRAVLGLAVDTATALTVRPAHSRVLGVAATVSTVPGPLHGVKLRAVGVAVEGDTAGQIVRYVTPQGGHAVILNPDGEGGPGRARGGSAVAGRAQGASAGTGQAQGASTGAGRAQGEATTVGGS